jgi:DNA modification methylase
MIKFFRKIRQNMIKENKVSKYLLYAIGEIALVVIGILIALQVNNNNELKKDRIVEEEYLIGLKDDFEFNLNELNKNIELNQKKIEDTKNFLAYTGPIISDKTEQDIASRFGDIMKNSVGFEPNPGILEDLISSGNLNKITNGNLRRILSVWKADLLKAKIQENKILLYRDNIVQLFIENGSMRNMLADTLHIDTTKFKISAKNTLQDPRLENNLAFFMITSMALKYEDYPKLKTDISTILNLINPKLK